MPFFGRRKSFSKWNRIHTNGKPVHRAHTQCIDSNRASYEKKTREKIEEESIQKSISMQLGVLLIQMYCSVLKLLLLLSLAFGLTAFYSSQLDMVFKWRKSNSFKWIAIIVRKREREKNSWESKRHRTQCMYCSIFSHVGVAGAVENEAMIEESEGNALFCSVLFFFVLSSANRIKNWYTW